MQRYVNSFMFDSFGQFVLLIRKNKPVWQMGKLNGIGGKIESGETSIEAMAREFKEEAGLELPEESFTHFGTIGGVESSDTSRLGADWSMDCYTGFLSGKVFSLARSVTDENIFPYRVLSAINSPDALRNVPWLIQMALSWKEGVRPFYRIVES